MYWLYNLVYISNPPILFVYHMHVVKQVVQQSSGSGCSVFIGFGQNRNPKKIGDPARTNRPELSFGAPLQQTRNKQCKHSLIVDNL